MKRKQIIIILLLLSAFIFGYITTFLYYKGFWSDFIKGLTSVPGIIHFLYFLVSLFFVILVHELGHFSSFRKHKIKVKALYTLMFAFVKEDNKVKVRLVPKFLLLLGGIVIPDHLVIRNKEDEDEIIGIFKKVLLSGPNTSLVYGVIVFIVWVFFLFFPFYILNGFLFTFMATTTIMTYLVFKSSKISTNGIYGDFVASEQIEKNDLFKYTYLYQLVTQLNRDDESIDYLWPSIVNTLTNRSPYSNKLYKSLLLNYLDEVTFHNQIGSTGVSNKFESYIKRLGTQEDDFILHNYFIYYYYSLNDNLMATTLLNELNHKEYKINKRVKVFYQKLTNHLLGFKDESEFLSNDKNFHPQSLSWIYKPLKIENKIIEIRKD